MSDPLTPEELLQSAGIRPTPARSWIMACLIRSGLHPTTDELARILRDKGAAIPAATLYQSLEKLTQAGLLTRFSGADGQARYDANVSFHHHMICRSCHRVLDVKIDNPLSSLRIIDDTSGEPVLNWTLEDAAIELKGLCPSCRIPG